MLPDHVAPFAVLTDVAVAHVPSARRNWREALVAPGTETVLNVKVDPLVAPSTGLVTSALPVWNLSVRHSVARPALETPRTAISVDPVAGTGTPVAVAAPAAFADRSPWLTPLSVHSSSTEPLLVKAQLIVAAGRVA